ncbi:MAG: hypothetical protein ACO3N7_11100 [Kiritimatiellia bacterium]
MKSLISLSALSPLSLLAHPGHPGAETHGDLTHVLIGLLVAVPAALLLAGLKLRAAKRAEVRVSRQEPPRG